MNEMVVLDLIKDFTESHLVGKDGLKDQQLLGFVVLDDDGEVIVASSFDPNYGETRKNPIRNWLIHCDSLQDQIQVIPLKDEDDFEKYAMKHFLALTANN